MSPEAEAVIHRARRSFGVSILILMVGFMAVAGALVYRINQKPGNEQYAAQSIALPQGAQIVSAVAQDGVITITYQIDGTTNIRLVNGADGAVIQNIAIGSE